MKNFAVPVLLSALLLTMTACGAGEPEAAAAPSAEAVVTPTATPTEPSAGELAASAGTSIPQPTAEQEAALLAEIEKINPAFINEKTVDNARNQCTSILGESPQENLVRAVKIRFEGQGVESVSDAEAEQLLEVIRTNGFCQ